MSHAAAFVSVLAVAGVIGGALLTMLGLFAEKWPALELANQGRPLVLIGSVAVLGLALILSDGALTAAAILLLIANVGLFVLGLQGAASLGRPESRRFVRMVTFNVWHDNARVEDVAAVLTEADADLIVLQEVTSQRRSRLHDLTKMRYPHILGSSGLLILAKHPVCVSGHIDGQVDRSASHGRALGPLLLWARFEVDGFAFELVGVHLTYPFKPLEQAVDTRALIAFVRSRKAPLIVAGDYNLTPWSLKLQRFTRETGLLRTNTFHLTWPMRRVIPLLPLVSIDNVFTSSEFAPLAVTAGPSAGSDHRPIIVDIALTRPDSMSKVPL